MKVYYEIFDGKCINTCSASVFRSIVKDCKDGYVKYKLILNSSDRTPSFSVQFICKQLRYIEFGKFNCDLMYSHNADIVHNGKYFENTKRKISACCCVVTAYINDKCTPSSIKEHKIKLLKAALFHLDKSPDLDKDSNSLYMQIDKECKRLGISYR